MKIYVGSRIKLQILPTSESHFSYRVIHGCDSHLNVSVLGGGSHIYLDRCIKNVSENFKIGGSIEDFPKMQGGDYILSMLLWVPLENRILEIENHGCISNIILDRFQFEEVNYFSDSSYRTAFTILGKDLKSNVILKKLNLSLHGAAIVNCFLDSKANIENCNVKLHGTASIKFRDCRFDNLNVALFDDSIVCVGYTALKMLSGLTYGTSSLTLSFVKGHELSLESRSFSEAQISGITFDSLRLITYDDSKIVGECFVKDIWYCASDSSKIQGPYALSVNGQRLDQSITEVYKYFPNTPKARPKARDLIMKIRSS